MTRFVEEGRRVRFVGVVFQSAIDDLDVFDEPTGTGNFGALETDAVEKRGNVLEMAVSFAHSPILCWHAWL